MPLLILVFLLTANAFAARGKLTEHALSESTIFPGTSRKYWIYVPAEYDETKPACLMIFQDGAGFVSSPGKPGFVPDVFDQLISEGKMPVTIGLFINPGVVSPPDSQKDAQPRFNRSYEYDGMGPNYANFLITEMIPLVTKDYNISANPDDRGLCGASSGAIASFTAAWEQPDHFRRVYSMIGTYVGLRGGHDYPTLIRKTEPKPLRIFLQDGKNDLNIYAGDWWMANQTMQRALEFAGYEHTYRWDDGGHSRQEGNKILPEALAWLWKDHGKKPVSVHLDQCKSRANEWLIPGEDWQIVSLGHKKGGGLAVTADGTLYFTNVKSSELFKITPDGKESLFAKDTAQANGIAIGLGGRTLLTAGKEVREYDLMSGDFRVVDEKAAANDIAVSNSGNIYYTSPQSTQFKLIQNWFIDETARGFLNPFTVTAYSFEAPGGIGLSADQSQLFVSDFHGPFIHSFTLNGGEALNCQPFFHAQRPTNQTSCALDGQCVATSGHLLAATAAGLQIFDQPGRLQLILPKPRQQDTRIHDCCLHQNTLYIATHQRIYKRKIKLTGAPAWLPPVKVPKPKL